MQAHANPSGHMCGSLPSMMDIRSNSNSFCGKFYGVRAHVWIFGRSIQPEIRYVSGYHPVGGRDPARILHGLIFKLMKLDAKICAKRSSMQKLLMSHLMGFNGIQYGCGRHISATRPGGVWAITLVNS